MTMNTVLLVLFGMFFVMVTILYVFAIFYFKKHEAVYSGILEEYRSHGYPLDSVTRAAEFLGNIAISQKISYFIRLYKGVSMNHKANEPVHPDAYRFIQSLPEERILWMLKLNKIFLLIYTLTVLMFIAGASYKYLV